MLPDDPEDSHDANRLNLLHYLYYNSHAQNLFWSTHEGYIDVGDFMLVNIDIGDILWMLLPDAYAER